MASGLPEGIYYEVTEGYVAGYTVTAYGDVGVIIPEVLQIASFTNTKDAPQTIPANPSVPSDKVDPADSPDGDTDAPNESHDTFGEINEGTAIEAETSGDAEPSQNNDPDDVNPQTGVQSSGLFAVPIVMLAAIAFVMKKRRCR